MPYKIHIDLLIHTHKWFCWCEQWGTGSLSMGYRVFSFQRSSRLTYKDEFVCLSVCLSVCPGIRLTFLRASTSNFTYNLIPRLALACFPTHISFLTYCRHTKIDSTQQWPKQPVTSLANIVRNKSCVTVKMCGLCDKSRELIKQRFEPWELRNTKWTTTSRGDEKDKRKLDRRTVW